MENVKIEVNIQQIEKESNDLAVKANSFVITTNDNYVAAMAFAKDIKAMQKEVEGAFGPIVKKAHETWKQAIAQRDKYLAPLKRALALLDGKGREFRRVQEAIRIAAELKAQELADKETARLEGLRKKAEARGDEKKAEEFETRAQEVAVAPIIAPTVSKIKGIVVSKIWKAEVTNLEALVKGVSAGTVPLNMVEGNEKALKAQSVATKGTLQYPGVRFYCEDSKL